MVEPLADAFGCWNLVDVFLWLNLIDASVLNIVDVFRWLDEVGVFLWLDLVLRWSNMVNFFSG